MPVQEGERIERRLAAGCAVGRDELGRHVVGGRQHHGLGLELCQFRGAFGRIGAVVLDGDAADHLVAAFGNELLRALHRRARAGVVVVREGDARQADGEQVVHDAAVFLVEADAHRKTELAELHHRARARVRADDGNLQLVGRLQRADRRRGADGHQHAHGAVACEGLDVLGALGGVVGVVELAQLDRPAVDAAAGVQRGEHGADADQRLGRQRRERAGLHVGLADQERLGGLGRGRRPCTDEGGERGEGQKPQVNLFVSHSH
ncbi:hypothetical protein FQZ97_835130 [compost metagenome]